MAEYMLCLYDSPTDFAHFSAEEMQAIIARYTAWADGLRGQDLLVASNKLADGEGRVMRPVDGQVRITEGPFSETKEVFGGYFLIRATSYEQAADVARTCPHLEYGGVIEIRRIDLH